MRHVKNPVPFKTSVETSKRRAEQAKEYTTLLKSIDNDSIASKQKGGVVVHHKDVGNVPLTGKRMSRAKYNEYKRKKEGSKELSPSAVVQSAKQEIMARSRTKRRNSHNYYAPNCLANIATVNGKIITPQTK